MTLSELEEEARKRKERLAQWKSTKQSQIPKRKEYEDEEEEQQQPPVESNDSPAEFPKPIFRNYKPSDSGQLSGAIVLPKPKLIDVKSLIEDQIKPKSTGNENSVSSVTEDVDLLSLAPRKPDWDLKRDAEKKLKRLEKRTAKAIAELTRERLLSEHKESLAEVVATTSKLNEAVQDDDDDD